TVFDAMGAIAGAPPFVTKDDPIETWRSIRVAGQLFEALRVKPAYGRAFTPADERPGAAPVAIISDRLWRRRFHADRALVGRFVGSRAGDVQIVGIMPAGFSYPLPSVTLGPIDVWLPFVPSASMIVRGGARVYTL